METIFAPWRIGYIRGEKPQGCVFVSVLFGVTIIYCVKGNMLT